MKIEKVITLASAETRLMFLAFERSLRASGCQLPLEVIPYNGNRFELPNNCTWLDSERLFAWVDQRCAHPMMRKYLPLTLAGYQYCDSDVIVLRNPEDVLSKHDGFVVACTEWNKPQWTVCRESRAALAQRSSTWQKTVFCAGQYACDKALFETEELIEFCERPGNRAACVEYPLHDQPGTNWLVLSSGIEMTNLTLPPFAMESTWAGDYGDNYEQFLLQGERSPYLIHWAGGLLDEPLPINDLFLQFLTSAEKAEWRQQQTRRLETARRKGRWPLGIRLLNRLVAKLDKRFWINWRPVEI